MIVRDLYNLFKLTAILWNEYYYYCNFIDEEFEAELYN